MVDQSRRSPESEPCPESGCILMIEVGVPHSAPCLVESPSRAEVVVVSVEIDGSVKWHAPRAPLDDPKPKAQSGSLCGRKGAITDTSDRDLVDCQHCLKIRERA